MNNRAIQVALMILACAAAPPQVVASPFTPGNTLTFDDTGVREYTSEGVFVQGIPVPIPVSPTHRDILDGVVDAMGRLHVFNMSDAGSFASTYDPVMNLWTHDPMPEYPTTFGSIDSGDVGILGHYAFFGFVRIDLRDYSHERFTTSVFGGATTSIGRNGLLYVAQSGSPAYRVAVLDPISLTEIRTLELHSNIYQDSRIHVTGITADNSGELFVTDINGVIFHFDSTGRQIAWTQPMPFHSSPLDIDLSHDGRIVVGYRFNALLFTDTSLASYHFVDLPQLDAPHVAFVQPPVPVPEPAAVGLGALGLLLLVACRRRGENAVGGRR